MLDGQAGAEDDEVASESRQECPCELQRGLIVDTQEEPILHRMVVDEWRHPPPALRKVAPAVVSDRLRHVKTLPSQILKSPGEIGVLPVEEEVRVEEPGRDLRGLEGSAPVEAGRSARPEDLLLGQVPSVRGLSGAAIEVTAGHRSIDTRRIDLSGRGKIRS